VALSARLVRSRQRRSVGLLRAVRQVGEQQPSAADVAPVAAMAIHSLLGARVSLLVCDTCDSVMAADGGTAPKPHSASDPSDLAPHYADLDLVITICVQPSSYPADVVAAVTRALIGKQGVIREIGFFDPDNFTFGTPLSRGALMAAIQDVSGVRAVERMRVRRRGYFQWRAFNEFALRVGSNELVRVTNDRLLPERGAVRLVMEGGA